MEGQGTLCNGNNMEKGSGSPRNAVIVLVWNVGFAGEQKKKVEN